jgi:hypothetical protein
MSSARRTETGTWQSRFSFEVGWLVGDLGWERVFRMAAKAITNPTPIHLLACARAGQAESSFFLDLQQPIEKGDRHVAIT